jgi:segregation and condensation protein B
MRVMAARPEAAASGRSGNMNTKRIVEAILFAADKPMTVKQIQQVFPELEQPDSLAIQDAIDAISHDYRDRPIGLKRLANGYRFQIKDGMAYWVSRLFEEKPPRYSRALLETLAIIAYRQPVTRGEIEDIRGVGVSSGIIHTLLEREWVRVIAHKEVPGRPALYGTTKHFLDYFNLCALSELPTVEQLAGLNFSNLPQAQAQQDDIETTQPQPATPIGNPYQLQAATQND